MKGALTTISQIPKFNLRRIIDVNVKQHNYKETAHLPAIDSHMQSSDQRTMSEQGEEGLFMGIRARFIVFQGQQTATLQDFLGHRSSDH
jgi:hypothetical protein